VRYGQAEAIATLAANVAVAQDPAGNVKPAKDKSTERIDGIVAAIMAIGRAMVAQDEPQVSYQGVLGLNGRGSRSAQRAEFDRP
jgi:phage terminase large subunit-like protein